MVLANYFSDECTVMKPQYQKHSHMIKYKFQLNCSFMHDKNKVPKFVPGQSIHFVTYSFDLCVFVDKSMTFTSQQL